jgi:hypothetical protein
MCPTYSDPSPYPNPRAEIEFSLSLLRIAAPGEPPAPQCTALENLFAPKSLKNA